MLSLGLISYHMELWFSDLFTSYEMELETHVHVQIENQLGFNELPIACYVWYGMLVWYDVSIIGYCRVWYVSMV